MLEETLALRDYDLKVNNIASKREYRAGLPAVTADPHQLEQVFLNIVNNAVDAMLESGEGRNAQGAVSTRDGYVALSSAIRARESRSQIAFSILSTPLKA